jgi:hypothetical protein
MGGLARLKEKCRDMRRVTFVENLARDLIYGAHAAQEPGVHRDPEECAVAAGSACGPDGRSTIKIVIQFVITGRHSSL